MTLVELTIIRLSKENRELKDEVEKYKQLWIRESNAYKDLAIKNRVWDSLGEA